MQNIKCVGTLVTDKTLVRFIVKLDGVQPVPSSFNIQTATTLATESASAGSYYLNVVVILCPSGIHVDTIQSC